MDPPNFREMKGMRFTLSKRRLHENAFYFGKRHGVGARLSYLRKYNVDELCDYADLITQSTLKEQTFSILKYASTSLHYLMEHCSRITQEFDPNYLVPVNHPVTFSYRYYFLLLYISNFL